MVWYYSGIACLLANTVVYLAVGAASWSRPRIPPPYLRAYIVVSIWGSLRCPFYSTRQLPTSNSLASVSVIEDQVKRAKGPGQAISVVA